MEFSDYTQNLGEFVKSRPRSGVRFLYFNASDLTTPRVNASLGQWKVRNTQCYVAPGNSPNYCYVFRKSHIRYLVKLHKAGQRGSATFYTANFKGGPKVEAFHGDHLTFGVVKSARFGVQLDSHYTFYHEDASASASAPFTFLRSVLACQLSPPPIDQTKTLEAFSACQCSLAKTTTIKDQYSADPFVVEMVYNLYKVVHEYPASGAGGAGGAGGASGGAGVDYKGITFLSAGFIRFLSEALFTPLSRLLPDLSSVQVFFDEMNELGEETNRTIVLMYDFEEYTRNIYYLQMETAFAAAYAHDHPATANAYEKNCLRQVMLDVQHPETGLAAVVGRGGGGAAARRIRRSGDGRQNAVVPLGRDADDPSAVGRLRQTAAAAGRRKGGI